MPQLNLAWWLFNFLLSWTFLLIIFTILINKNILTKNTQIQTPYENNNSTNNNLWPWT